VARVIYAEAAVQDLERIVDFLLAASPGAADAAVRQIRRAVEVLAEHPRIGRRVRLQMRELVITHGASGYLALYRFDPSLDAVRVLRVRHQREAGYRD
jgi:plasmid stabilization system protein ParE